MKKTNIMVESSLEHISKLKHLKSEADNLILCQHCKLHNLVALQGQKSIKTVPANPRPHANIRKKMLQKTLNRVLTLPKASARRELSIGVIYANRASICVELRLFYCGKRLLVPMLYFLL